MGSPAAPLERRGTTRQGTLLSTRGASGRPSTTGEQDAAEPEHFVGEHLEGEAGFALYDRFIASEPFGRQLRHPGDGAERLVGEHGPELSQNAVRNISPADASSPERPATRGVTCRRRAL
jgi:hypothetical protein